MTHRYPFCRVRAFCASLCGLCALGLAAIAEGASVTPPSPPPIRIADLEYIKGTFFFLADHPVRIQPGSVHIWKDNLLANPGVDLLGFARLDPEAPMDSVSNPESIRDFTPLGQESEFQIIYLWLVEGAPPDFGIPIVQLTTALGPSEVLAASYIDESSGVPVRVGTVTAADYEEADSVLGKPAHSLLVKMIKPRLDDLWDDSTGYFDRRTPWFPALFYELRNLYDLHQRDIPKDRFSLVVRRIDSGAPADPEFAYGVPLLQILGLDQMSEAGVQDTFVPDGRIDDQYIDYERGLIFFPDLHPFDPDTTNPGHCHPDFGGLMCLDNHARNVIRVGSFDFAAEANPRVYYKRNPDLFTDQRFYIEAAILPPPPPGGVLHQNAPNPFNPGTTIRFDLNYAGHTRVAIYDVQGKLVAKPLDAYLAAGPHQVPWTGSDIQGKGVASGVYFCELSTAGQRYCRRMVLAR